MRVCDHMCVYGEVSRCVYTCLWKPEANVKFLFLMFCQGVVLYCVVLNCVVLYCVVLFCVVLCCVVLYCVALFCEIGSLTGLWLASRLDRLASEPLESVCLHLHQHWDYKSPSP